MPKSFWKTGLLLIAAASPGCLSRPAQTLFEGDLARFVREAASVEYADVQEAASGVAASVEAVSPPLTVADEKPESYRDLSLEEAIQIGLANSTVMRDLGGAILRQPEVVRTAYDAGIRNSDPRFGVEAALSNFDAQWRNSALLEKNDRAFNNQLLAGGTRLFQQDLAVFQSQLSKRTATGTEFFLRRNTEYNANNALGNLFPSAWTTDIEAEARQPLLQGNGVTFNRLAGPSQQVGVFNGVVLSRIDTDVSLVEFELALRNLVSDIENAYWDLYFAYRDLNAKIAARNESLKTWQTVRGQLEAGRVEAEKEALAREQYYRLQLEVQNALTGRLFEGTHTANGSSGGTFRRGTGVHVAERRLRLILGLPINDRQLLRPLDEPVLARAVFNWPTITAEALTRRGELRRQRELVRRRELELIASRNYLLPRLDAVTRYRWRGFGKDLISANGGKPRFNNAWQNLLSGEFQEFHFGVEMEFPIGYRRAHAGVRHAELQLARERDILAGQERQILHDLSNAVAEVERSYATARTSHYQRVAAREQLAAVQAAFDADKATADQVLDAQRRLAESEQSYFQALVEYAVAVKNVHFEKGTLMDYNQIVLSEGAWPGVGESVRATVARRQPSLNYLIDASAATPQAAQGREPSDGPAAGATAGGEPTSNGEERTGGGESSATASVLVPRRGAATAIPASAPGAVAPTSFVEPAERVHEKLPESAAGASPRIQPFEPSATEQRLRRLPPPEATPLDAPAEETSPFAPPPVETSPGDA